MVNVPEDYVDVMNEEFDCANLAVNVLPKVQGDELSTSQHSNSEIIEAGVSRVWVCFGIVAAAPQRTLSGSTNAKKIY